MKKNQQQQKKNGNNIKDPLSINSKQIHTIFIQSKRQNLQTRHLVCLKP